MNNFMLLLPQLVIINLLRPSYHKYQPNVSTRLLSLLKLFPALYLTLKVPQLIKIILISLLALRLSLEISLRLHLKTVSLLLWNKVLLNLRNLRRKWFKIILKKWLRKVILVMIKVSVPKLQRQRNKSQVLLIL